ncbi:MAG: chemotaxis protein CheW [Elainella sp.]
MPFNPSSTDLSFADLDLVFAELDTELDAATPVAAATDSESVEREISLEQAAASDLAGATEPAAANWHRSAALDSGSDRSMSQLAHRMEGLPLEETYLKFRLESDVPAAINVRFVQEAFILPARQLTTMPNMPAALLGLTNRRNQVVWVIDLAQLLGLAVFDATVQQFSLLLIQVGTIRIGLAVQQIEGMVRLSPEVIQAPIGQMSLSLLPYLQGCTLQQQEGHQEILLLLDAEAIIQAPLMKYPFV